MGEETDHIEETAAATMPGPSRQSIDLRRRAKFREVEWLEDQNAVNPCEEAANNIDGTEEDERRRKWTLQLSAFLEACPDRLRGALQRALSKPGRITKCALARDAGISRPTLDRWLESASSATWGTTRPPFGRIAV